MATESSTVWLRERASESFGIDRFRPHVVIAGTEPWEEDTCADFRIREASLRGVVAWPRCAIPQIDQVTGDRHKEPAKALRRHRWCLKAPDVREGFRSIVEGNALFGVACSVAPEGAIISLGHAVGVDSHKEPTLPTAIN